MLDLVDAMCNVVVIDCFLNEIKAAAWGGRPCSPAYSKVLATLSQRRRHFLNVLVEVTKPTKTLNESAKKSSAVDANPLADYDFSWKQTKKTHKHNQAFFFF